MSWVGFLCVCVCDIVPGGVKLDLQHWGGVLRKYKITEWERGLLDIQSCSSKPCDSRIRKHCGSGKGLHMESGPGREQC